MFWIVTVVLLLILSVLFAVYRIRCAVAPFTKRGRRRLIYWARGWWRGQQAQNRDVY